MVTKLLIVVFSIVFGAGVITIFTADRFYSIGITDNNPKLRPEDAIKLLDIAAKLDPMNANIYFQKYKILEDKVFVEYDLKKEKLNLLKRCINLCPPWPDYHIYYAVTLRRMVKSPNAQTKKLILSELSKSVKLKQNSDLYKEIYDKYEEVFAAK